MNCPNIDPIQQFMLDLNLVEFSDYVHNDRSFQVLLNWVILSRYNCLGKNIEIERKIALRVGVTRATVTRWRKGEAFPHWMMRKDILKVLLQNE